MKQSGAERANDQEWNHTAGIGSQAANKSLPDGRIDQTLFRPSEIMISRGDASKAAERLGWKPKYKMTEVVRMMVEAASEAEQ